MAWLPGGWHPPTAHWQRSCGYDDLTGAAAHTASSSAAQILHIMEQHEFKRALLDWLHSTPSRRRLPLLLLQYGNLRLAARPASLSRLPVQHTSAPPAPPPPQQHPPGLQQLVLDKLQLLYDLQQWLPSTGDVQPVATRLYTASCRVANDAREHAAPDPLVQVAYVDVLLDAGQAEPVLELLKPQARDEVALLLHAVAHRPAEVQSVLATALYGRGGWHRQPTWNEVGALLAGNNARHGIQALTYSSAQASMRILDKAMQRRPRTRNRRKQPNPKGSSQTAPPLPHTPPKLVCTHLLHAPLDCNDNDDALQRFGWDTALPEDVDVKHLVDVCSATKASLLPMRLPVQIALQASTPPPPATVAIATALIGAHATRGDGYGACKMLALLDASGAQVPPAAVAWALLGAVNGAPHVVPALRLLLVESDVLSAATQDLLWELVAGDRDFVQLASDAIAREMRKQVAKTRDREESMLRANVRMAAASCMAADLDDDMAVTAARLMRGDRRVVSRAPMPKVLMDPAGWDAFLGDCHMLTHRLHALLTAQEA